MPKFKHQKTGAIVDVPKSPGPDWVPADDEGDDAYKNGAVKNFGTSTNPDWRERSGGRWVPLDDVGVNAADPSDLLGANGYHWSPQNKPGAGGPSALWIDPEGRTVTEAAATARVQREGAAAPAAPRADPNVMTAAQSAAVGMQRAQLDETIRVNDAQIARWEREDAQKAIDAEYLHKKDEWAQRNGDARLQLDTQTQLANIQAQRDTLAFNIQQATQRSLELQQQRQMDVDQFNAQQGLAVDKANLEANDRRQQRLQEVNRDIGVLAQDTGNRGRFAAFATAASPWSGPSTNAAQLIDAESVKPLEQSLQTRQGLMNQSATPFGFKPLALNPLGGRSSEYPELTQQQVNDARNANPNWDAQYAAGRQMAAAYNASQGATAPPQAQTATAGSAGGSWLDRLLAGDQSALGDLMKQGYTPANTNAQGDIPKMERGGMVRGAFMAGDSSDGDENPEVIVPLEAGTIVVSLKGLPKDKIREAKGKLQKFATGGLFDFLGDDTLSKGFLTEASKKARAGSPWETGPLPSPVYASSPGFDPDVAAFLDSIRALEQGIPTSYSARLTAKARPNGLSERIIGRSR